MIPVRTLEKAIKLQIEFNKHKHKTMKNILKITCIAITLLMSGLVVAQEKPFRIGVKIGYPNIIGGNIEYVTPLLKKRLAPSLEYSTINADKALDPDQAKLTYFQAGLNYYFFKEGRGLYGNLSYGILDAKLKINDIESDTDPDLKGSASTAISNNSINIKIGAKWGKGFYFRPEIGYSFTNLDKEILVNVNFPDGSTETQTETLPSILTQGIVFNIGFGMSF